MNQSGRLYRRSSVQTFGGINSKEKAMDFKALRDSLKKKHHLYPVKEEQPSGDFKYYVLLASRDRCNGKLQSIYLEVESEDQAGKVIEKLAGAIKATNDKCMIHPLRNEYYFRFASKPQKIEAGFYEYRGYEIMDMYDQPGHGFSKIDRWSAREKPWLEGKYFGGFNTLRDAMLAVDKHLDNRTSETK